MKLDEYIKVLQDLKKKYGNLELVYSSDEEGNSFNKLFYAPSAGELDEDENFNSESEVKNAICIN